MPSPDGLPRDTPMTTVLLPVAGLSFLALGVAVSLALPGHPALAALLIAAGGAALGWALATRGLRAALQKIVDHTLRIGDAGPARLPSQDIPALLHVVVDAVNALSSRLQHIFAKESERAETLRREALTDPLSQLANRRGFQLAYANQFEHNREINGGMLIMLVVDHLADFNGLEGFAAGDALIVAVTDVLSAALPDAVTGRISGGTFVAVTRSTSVSQLATQAAHLVEQVRGVLARGYPAPLSCHAGAVLFDGQAPAVGALLGDADLALIVARANRQPVELVMHRKHATTTMGASAWRGALQEALSGNGIRLAMQPVIDLRDGRWLQAELFSRLTLPDGAEAAARQFMPMAARHQLVAAFDRHVLRTLSAHAAALSAVPDGARIVINLGAQSLDVPDLSQTIAGLLDQPVFRGRLAFELSETALDSHEIELRRLIPLFAAAGAQWGVDHFGIESQWLAHLVQWRPDYIKLAGNYLNNLREQESGRFCISAVVRTADVLGIAVYASMVEDPLLLPILAECGVRGAQGYALRAPELLSAG